MNIIFRLLKKTLIYGLIILISASFLFIPQKVIAAVCTITLDSANIVGDKIEFTYTLNGTTPQNGEKILLTINDNYHQPEYIEIKNSPFQVDKPTRQTDFYIGLESKDPNRVCVSSAATYYTNDTITGIGGQIDPYGPMDPCKDTPPPALTGIRKINGDNVTVTLAWQDKSNKSFYPDNKGFIEINGSTKKEVFANNGYYQYEETFSKTETRKYRAYQSFPAVQNKYDACDTAKSQEVTYDGNTQTLKGMLPFIDTVNIINQANVDINDVCDEKCLGLGVGISASIGRAICYAQCRLIAELGEFLGWLVKEVLMESLGF